MLILLFFIIISFVVSYIDIRRGVILDKVMLPSFVVLLLMRYFENSLVLEDFIAIAIVLILFTLPILFNMSFGGGDLRYGAFAALFVGLEGVGYFIMFSGLFHLILLILIKKKSFPFAPAMSLGALGAYMVGNL